MMTPAAAKNLLTSLSVGARDSGKQLHYVVDGGLAFCPVCGTSAMKDFSFKFAAIDGHDAVKDRDGLLLVYLIEHPSIKRVCLFGLAGAPENGDTAARMLAYGEALQVINMEALMRGQLS